MALPSTFGQALSRPLTGALAAAGRETTGRGRDIKELAYKAFVVAQEEGILVEAWLPEQIQVDLHADYDAPFAQGFTDAAGQMIGNMARFAGMSLTTQALTAQVWQGGSNIQFSLPLIFQAESSGVSDVMKPIKDLMRLMLPKDPQDGGLLEAPGPRLDLGRVTEGGQSEVYRIIGGGTTSLNQKYDQARNALESMTTDIGNKNFGGVVSKTIDGIRTTAGEVARPVSRAIVNSVKNNISLYIGQFQYFPSVVVTDVSPTFDVVIGPDKNPLRASVVVQFRTFYTPTDRDIEGMFPSAQSDASQSGTTGFTTAPGSRLG
jgi:hypothetical protein